MALAEKLVRKAAMANILTSFTHASRPYTRLAAPAEAKRGRDLRGFCRFQPAVERMLCRPLKNVGAWRGSFEPSVHYVFIRARARLHSIRSTTGVTCGNS